MIKRLSISFIIFCIMIIFSNIVLSLSYENVDYFSFNNGIAYNDFANKNNSFIDTGVSYLLDTDGQCFDGRCIETGIQELRLENNSWTQVEGEGFTFGGYFRFKSTQDSFSPFLWTSLNNGYSNNYIYCAVQTNILKCYLEGNPNTAVTVDTGISVTDSKGYFIYVVADTSDTGTDYLRVYINGTEYNSSGELDGTSSGITGGYVQYSESNDYTNLIIDEQIVSVRAFDSSDINTMQNCFNNGVTFGDCLGPLPIINLTYPQNDTYFNDWNGSIELNTTGLYDNCTINDTRLSIEYDNGTIFRFVNNTEFDSDLYKFEIVCSFDSRTKDFFIDIGVDTIFPIININSPLNNSEYDISSINTILISEDYVDNNAIHDYNFTIFYPNGSLLYNEYVDDVSNVSDINLVNYTYLLNLDDLETGEYSIYRFVRDTHTDRNIKDKLKKTEYFYQDVNINEERIIQDFGFQKLKYVKDKDIDVDFIIENDKITMEFSKLKANKVNSYVIESEEKIYYYPQSEKYNCHIVTGNLWSDCNGLENAYLEIIDDYSVRVNFIPSKTFAKSKSTGFLNTYEATTYFNLIEDTEVPINQSAVNIIIDTENIAIGIFIIFFGLVWAIMFIIAIIYINPTLSIINAIYSFMLGLYIISKVDNVGFVIAIFMLFNIVIAILINLNKRS